MGNILLITEADDLKQLYREIASKRNLSFDCRSTETSIYDMLEVEAPYVIVVDSELTELNLEIIIKKIKTTHENIQILYHTKQKSIPENFTRYITSVVTPEFSMDMIIATLDICLKNKEKLEIISEKNKHLSNSLYRLNVLYNTSTQFAGTLDTKELLRYMIEGLDRSLSFDLTCTISFGFENEPVLLVHSLYDLSEELLNALKLRAILNYKSLFENDIPFEIDDRNLKVIKIIKNPTEKFTFSIFRFDNMFSAIDLGDKFFGCIEILREKSFSTEDATYFQTIIQQASLPLKSASLYNEIIQKNEKLERLEHIKSEFISIVSHELRTPLTPIKNALSILKSGRCGELSESAMKFIDMACRNVQNLTGIINDILDINKIEAGKMNFNYNLMDIHTVIENVSNNFGSVAREHEINFATDEQADLPEIFADSQRLEQVLINLVSNAIKFTNNGKKIVIKSELKNADDIVVNQYFEKEIKNLCGEYIIVSVIDEGIGIKPENLSKAFDKFTQIESSTFRNVGGTGLGLPIAKQLIKAHKGAIWCDSEEGKGSTFSFALPVSVKKQEELTIQKELI